MPFTRRWPRITLAAAPLLVLCGWSLQASDPVAANSRCQAIVGTAGADRLNGRRLQA
jgi:hypothetical protein